MCAKFAVLICEDPLGPRRNRIRTQDSLRLSLQAPRDAVSHLDGLDWGIAALGDVPQLLQ